MIPLDNKLDLTELLEYIDPSTLSYGDWTNVGMALKHENYDASVWDEWSRNDSRYHEGECFKKWDTFKGNGSPVTGATITKLAKENGWTSKWGDGDDTFLDWNSSFIATETDKGYKLVNTDWVLGQEIIEPKFWNPSQQIIEYLEAVFNPGDVIGYVNDGYLHTNGENEKWIPKSSGVYTKTAGDIIQGLRNSNGDVWAVMGDPNTNSGAWIRFNPLDGEGVKNTNVTEFKYALVESDNMSIEQRNEIIRELELPVVALSYSGSKSIHAIVKVDAVNYPQYQERVDYLYKYSRKNGLKVDKQNKNPSRLTRLPRFIRGEKKQFLIDKNIGKSSWDEWEEYIEDMNDNLPDPESLEELFEQKIELALN